MMTWAKARIAVVIFVIYPIFWLTWVIGFALAVLADAVALLPNMFVIVLMAMRRQIDLFAAPVIIDGMAKEIRDQQPVQESDPCNT